LSAALAFTLQPEARYLELVAPLFSLVDAFEICPETTWRRDRSGKLVANGFHARFAEILARTGKFAIAHGVAFSLGSARPDAARREQWLERIAADVATFRYRWYTDHLGVTELDGMNLTLPLALPATEEAAASVRASLATMQTVVPDVGFENSVFYDHASAPADEPAFITRCLDRPRTHLVLDLHNVFTTARNQGIDARRYVAELPLERVIEIHLSGGSESDPAWLPEGRTIRLDSHDAAVPEEVWRLAEAIVPRCSNLSAVTLERMEGTVSESDVAVLETELRRARRLVDAR
jgi:uncharacterized protein (UPF0276 family)